MDMIRFTTTDPTLPMEIDGVECSLRVGDLRVIRRVEVAAQKAARAAETGGEEGLEALTQACADGWAAVALAIGEDAAARVSEGREQDWLRVMVVLRALLAAYDSEPATRAVRGSLTMALATIDED